MSTTTSTSPDQDLLGAGARTTAPLPSVALGAEVSGQLSFKPWWEIDAEARASGQKAASAAEEGAPVSKFKYSAFGTVLEGTTQCTPPSAAMHRRFEQAFDAYVQMHADMLAGRIPARFIHVSVGWKSTVQNSMKVAASAALLGMVLKRAVVVSWPRHLDPDSVYWDRRAFEDLFEPVPFNWTYDITKFALPHFQRYDVHGWGAEEYVEQEPVHRMFCSDITRDNTTWIELWWRYGFIGPLLWHSPYTHDIVSQWLNKDDMYGPLARKLFRPIRRIWYRINAFRELHFAGHRVVGLYVQGGRVAFGHMLEAVNRDVKSDVGGEWAPYKLAASANPLFDSDDEFGSLTTATDVAGNVDELDAAAAAMSDFFMVRANNTKVFVVSRDHLSMRTILRGFGNEPQLLYYPHRNFSDPGDEGVLIDTFLLAFCDAVYAGPSYIDTLGTMFSRRPRIVQMMNHKKEALPDGMCHPCLSMAGIEKTRCFSEKMAFPESPYKCEREYPIF